MIASVGKALEFDWRAWPLRGPILLLSRSALRSKRFLGARGAHALPVTTRSRGTRVNYHAVARDARPYRWRGAVGTTVGACIPRARMVIVPPATVGACAPHARGVIVPSTRGWVCAPRGPHQVFRRQEERAKRNRSAPALAPAVAARPASIPNRCRADGNRRNVRDRKA